MPSKKALPTRELPAISKELLDQLVTGPMSPAEAQEIASTFKKALYERILGAELSHHLGYKLGEARPSESSNHRNGATGKTVLTEDGPLRLEMPRDRDDSFEPLLIPKHEHRFTGFDDKILGCMHAA